MRLLRWGEGRSIVDDLLRTRKLEHVPASEELDVTKLRFNVETEAERS
jgi:hypothetical protein